MINLPRFFARPSRFYELGSGSGGWSGVRSGIPAMPSRRLYAAFSPSNARPAFGCSTSAILRRHRPQLAPLVSGLFSSPSFAVCWLILPGRAHAIVESCARLRRLRRIVSTTSCRVEATPSTSKQSSRPRTELIARSSSSGSAASNGSRCKLPQGSPRRPAGSVGVGSSGTCNPHSRADLAISHRTLSRRGAGSD